jgi:hypothetical protein
MRPDRTLEVVLDRTCRRPGTAVRSASVSVRDCTPSGHAAVLVDITRTVVPVRHVGKCDNFASPPMLSLHPLLGGTTANCALTVDADIPVVYGRRTRRGIERALGTANVSAGCRAARREVSIRGPSGTMRTIVWHWSAARSGFLFGYSRARRNCQRRFWVRLSSRRNRRVLTSQSCGIQRRTAPACRSCLARPRPDVEAVTRRNRPELLNLRQLAIAGRRLAGEAMNRVAARDWQCAGIGRDALGT